MKRWRIIGESSGVEGFTTGLWYGGGLGGFVVMLDVGDNALLFVRRVHRWTVVLL